MNRNIKRIAMGIIAAILVVWMLPFSAAGQTHPRILNLYMEEVDARYEIYFAASLTDALFGIAKISRRPSGEELEQYQRAENLVAVVTTDEKGSAAVNFSETGLEDGVYLITGPACQPFYVCVPAPDGDAWLYTVEVYPGYLIGGETEPMPTSEKMIRLSTEQPAAEPGELGGIFLVLAGCWAFLRRVLRPECW